MLLPRLDYQESLARHSELGPLQRRIVQISLRDPDFLQKAAGRPKNSVPNHLVGNEPRVYNLTTFFVTVVQFAS